jgi:ferredoxin/flavodoxin---NADP+ reductase
MVAREACGRHASNVCLPKLRPQGRKCSHVTVDITEDEIFDVTLIGAGPVGLFGSFYAGMRGMKTKIVDSLPEFGGQLSTLYPEKYVFDMPGFPKILARTLANEMAEQGLRFQPATALGERVESLSRRGDGIWTLRTDKSEHLSRTVIICAGAGAFSAKRLGIPGVEDFEDRGLHYFVQKKDAFAGKRLLIVGGGDSAVDWAMNLEPMAERITLIHRRDAFRAHEESVDWLLNRSTVSTKLFWEIRRLEGDGRLERAVIFNNRTGEEETLDVDACLINIGFNASIGPIRDWGLTLEASSIVVNSRMETNLPGVYSAGDVCTYDGKLKLIATGVGEVCIAVNFAKTLIDPSAKAFPGHSSNMGL